VAVVSSLDLRPIVAPSSGGSGRRFAALTVAIVLLLVTGVGAAFVRGADDSAPSATAEDLRLIQSSSAAVDALDALEMTVRFEVDDQTVTMAGTGNATAGRFTVSVPGLDDFELIQAGDRAYLPAFGRPGWTEFVLPPGATAEASTVIAGQDPLANLRAISSSSQIDIVGEGSVDGATVTRYRTEIALADALRAAESNLGNLGLPADEVRAVLADAPPMRVEVAIDEAGIPRRTRVAYEIQRMRFELEIHVRPVGTVDRVGPPPADEIVESHPATDTAHLQQLIGLHMAQHATG
jgi:hypothetical protein